MVSLQGYTGANPIPPGHGREQPLYGSYPYGDYIQGYPQGGYLPAAGETRGGGVRRVVVLSSPKTFANTVDPVYGGHH